MIEELVASIGVSFVTPGGENFSLSCDRHRHCSCALEASTTIRMSTPIKAGCIHAAGAKDLARFDGSLLQLTLGR
jgi:hypothetical protein